MISAYGILHMCDFNREEDPMRLSSSAPTKGPAHAMTHDAHAMSRDDQMVKLTDMGFLPEEVRVWWV